MGYMERALVDTLNNYPTVEIVVTKDLIDEIDMDPEELEKLTGRKWRNAIEFTSDANSSFSHEEEKIVFNAKEDL